MSPLTFACRSRRREPTRACPEDTWRTETTPAMRTRIPLQPSKPNTSPALGIRRSPSTPVTRTTATWRRRKGRDCRRQRESTLILILTGKFARVKSIIEYLLNPQVKIQIIRQQQVSVLLWQQVSVSLRLEVEVRQPGQQEVFGERLRLRFVPPYFG